MSLGSVSAFILGMNERRKRDISESVSVSSSPFLFTLQMEYYYGIDLTSRDSDNLPVGKEDISARAQHLATNEEEGKNNEQEVSVGSKVLLVKRQADASLGTCLLGLHR